MQEIFRINLDGVNCYLGKENEKFILFDTGGHMILDKTFDNRYNALLTQLKAYGCTSENLKLIVLTHGDNDHIANASALRNYFGTKIAIHKEDRVLAENPDIDMVMNTFKYRGVLFKLVFFIMKKQIHKIMVKTLEDYERFHPDIFLDDGDKLNEYGFNAQILHLPGHTPGSIAVLTANGELIAGDLFAVNKPGKPETALLAYDFNILKASVDRVKSIGVKTVLPGHGDPFDMTLYNL